MSKAWYEVGGAVLVVESHDDGTTSYNYTSWDGSTEPLTDIREFHNDGTKITEEEANEIWARQKARST